MPDIKKPKLKEVKDDKDEDINKPDYEDLYKRALADYQNLKKQTMREKEEFAKFANEKLLEEVLPVYDNLKLAQLHSTNGENGSSIDEGIKHVTKQFKEALEKFGVEEIAATDQLFDHNLMDAIGKQETDDESKDSLVSQEVRPGYKLNGKVIAHAKVIVWEFNK
jgi:molecular chaperone GrpE